MKRLLAILPVVVAMTAAVAGYAQTTPDPTLLISEASRLPLNIRATFEAKYYHAGKVDEYSVLLTTGKVQGVEMALWEVQKAPKNQLVKFLATSDHRYFLQSKPGKKFKSISPSALKKRFAGANPFLRDLAFAWEGDATPSVLGTPIVNGYSCWLIESKANKRAKATLPIVRYAIRRDNGVMEQLEVMDKKRNKRYKVSFTDWHRIGSDRLMFTEMEILDDNSDQWTRFILKNLDVAEPAAQTFAPALERK